MAKGTGAVGSVCASLSLSTEILSGLPPGKPWGLVRAGALLVGEDVLAPAMHRGHF